MMSCKHVVKEGLFEISGAQTCPFCELDRLRAEVGRSEGTGDEMIPTPEMIEAAAKTFFEQNDLRWDLAHPCTQNAYKKRLEAALTAALAVMKEHLEIDRLRAESADWKAEAEANKAECLRLFSELDRLQAENERLRADIAELVTFVRSYRDTEDPSYLWSLSTALLDKHAPPVLCNPTAAAD